ncbi:unnamed protein product, partial [Rotaria socialis]
PNIALQHTRLVLIPHSITHINDHHGIISIINNTRHSKSIPRNTPLGFISPIDSVADINTIQELANTSRHVSSEHSILFSCSHCNVPFSSETTLYDHLLECCNKHLTCTTRIISNLVEHITDPVKQMKVYLMLHQYYQLFDDSCLKG